jgi:competence protein ComEA
MPELPISRARALVIGGCALVALVFAGKVLVPAGAASDSGAVPTHAPTPLRAGAAPLLVVHVVGAVRSPGLYKLRRGARVADAVSKAGGATAKADLALVNLAAPVSDGQQIVVAARAPPAAAPGPASSGAPVGPLHLNSATVEQLDGLPGVGPVTAQKIVDYRTAHGAFSSVDDLDAIPGIGPARLEQLRELVAP